MLSCERCDGFRRQHRETWLENDSVYFSFEIVLHPSLEALRAAADLRCQLCTVIWHHLSIADHPSDLESTLDAQAYLKFDAGFSFVNQELVVSVRLPGKNESHWSPLEFPNLDWSMSFKLRQLDSVCKFHYSSVMVYVLTMLTLR